MGFVLALPSFNQCPRTAEIRNKGTLLPLELKTDMEDVDSKDKNGWTTLSHATWSGRGGRERNVSGEGDLKVKTPPPGRSEYECSRIDFASVSVVKK